MIKMVAVAWRKPGMTREEFTARWRDEHAPLVEKYKEAMGFSHYRQNHYVESPEIEAFAASRNWASPPDGVAELFWESEEALQKTFKSEAAAEASAILAADEAEFVDMSRTMAYLAREHDVF